MKIQTACILILLAVLAALPAHAQTTVNFDNPTCVKNTNPGLYQGINFSTGTPWDCEASNYAGASGLSLSWTQPNVTSGTFKFAVPSVLNSFLMATSTAGSTLKVSTDQGESVTIAPTSKWVTYQTNFSKPATTVTVSCTCGWTLEMDNLIYTTGSVTPPPPPTPTITAVVASCAPASIASTATSQCKATVTGTGSFSSSVTWSTSDGSISAAGVLTPSGTATSATVKATSTQDTTKSGSFQVAIALPPPPPTISFSISGLPANCTLATGVLSCSNAPAPTTLALTCSTANCSVTAPSVTISLGTTAGGGHSATLSWTASVPAVAGYKVYRSITSGTYTAPITAAPITTTSFTDSTVQAGAQYFYVTTAVDAAGNESIFSNEVSATIPTP